MSELNILVKLAKDYFEKEPYMTSYKLPKAHLGKELGIGINKQGNVCRAIANEFDFITDSKGYLLIDKIKFLMWHRAIEQQKSQEITWQEIEANYPLLVKEIEENEEKLQRARAVVKAREDRRDKQEREIAELEDKLEKLPDQINYLKNKKEELSVKLEPLQAERSKLAKEVDDFAELFEDFEARKQSSSWLFRQTHRSKIKEIERLMREVWQDQHLRL